MAKDFKKALKKEPTKIVSDPNTSPKDSIVEAADHPITNTKKPGRPKIKTEPTKTINIAVPVSILDQIDIALVKYQGNMTKYVNEVIKKDLNQHLSEYKQLYDLMNK